MTRYFVQTRLILFFPSLVLGALLSAGCADSPSSNSTYDSNSFFSGQTPAPDHSRRVNLDFFNKVCSPSGSTSSENGKQYDCHYTSD